MGQPVNCHVSVHLLARSRLASPAFYPIALFSFFSTYKKHALKWLPLTLLWASPLVQQSRMQE